MLVDILQEIATNPVVQEPSLAETIARGVLYTAIGVVGVGTSFLFGTSVISFRYS